MPCISQRADFAAHSATFAAHSAVLAAHTAAFAYFKYARNPSCPLETNLIFGVDQF